MVEKTKGCKNHEETKTTKKEEENQSSSFFVVFVSSYACGKRA